MRVGVSLTTNYSGYDDPRLAVRHAVERARAARQSDLDSLFVGDRHATAEPYLQNVPTLARMLAEWGDRPAGALFLLPLWHPVLLAEQVGTLASIAGGRFVVQCGIGTGRAQFAAMGASLKTRPSAFEETLSICRRLWAGETVSSEGRFEVENARINPRPPEPVEVWMACGQAGMDRAARLGDGWLGTPSTTLAGAREELATYRERCEAHGHAPSAIALRRDVYVGATEAEAARVRDAAVAGGYRGFPAEALVAGTAELVADQLAPFAEAGFTDVLFRHLTNDQSLVLGSLERLSAVRDIVARH
jgi:alkanesulfonate monooxygenase SsuD/methylene tetrahydromethanopterin reductase-like flavin-dependent oxidoreductase (luciferase family)